MTGVRTAVGILSLVALSSGVVLVAPSALGGPEAQEAPRIAPRILLVVEGEPGALFRRLQAELEQLGFSVRAEQQGGTSLAERAGRVGANAAIRIPRSRNAVEVWVADPEGDASVLKEVVISHKKGATDDAVVATRSVELLRASFLEIHLEMPEPPPPDPPTEDASVPAVEATDAGAPDGSAASDAEAAPPPPSPTVARPKPSAPAPRSPAGPADSSGQPPLGSGRELRLVGVVAGSASPGGVPADAHLGLGLSLEFSKHWAASGLLLSPSLFTQLDGNEGSAALHVSLGLLELAWKGGTTLEPVLGAGAGVAWLLTSGDAASGFQAQSDGGVVGIGALRAGLGWQLSDTVRATLDGRVGATTSRVSVRFDTREVAEWGRPLVLLSAGVEVRLD